MTVAPAMISASVSVCVSSRGEVVGTGCEQGGRARVCLPQVVGDHGDRADVGGRPARARIADVVAALVARGRRDRRPVQVRDAAELLGTGGMADADAPA